MRKKKMAGHKCPKCGKKTVVLDWSAVNGVRHVPFANCTNGCTWTYDNTTRPAILMARASAISSAERGEWDEFDHAMLKYRALAEAAILTVALPKLTQRPKVAP